MTCPYTNCSGEVQEAEFVVHCKTCARPILLCLMCKTANRTLARYCRTCGELTKKALFPSTRSRQILLQGITADFPDESRLIKIDVPFWVAPVMYGEFLWCISTNGTCFCVSPFNENPSQFGLLGDGFGKSPFVIREITKNGEVKASVPYLLAANPESVKGINLLTEAAEEFIRVLPPAYLLSDIESMFVTLEADTQNTFFLKRCEDQTTLVAGNLMNSTCEDFPLDVQDVVGPFKLGHRIGVYSKDFLGILENGQFQTHPFPRGFTAWVHPDQIKGLFVPPGRMPFIIHENSIYILGVRSDVSGFAFMSFEELAPASVFVSVERESAYGEDIGGSPVIVRRGEILIYQGTSHTIIRKDTQLIPAGPPMHQDNLTIGFVKGYGGGKLLRFYHENDSYDYSLGKLNDLTVPIGFYKLTGALVFAYLTKDSHIRMLVWDI